MTKKISISAGFLVGVLIMIYFFGTPIGLFLIEKPIYLLPPTPQRFSKDALYIMNKYGVFSDENNAIAKETYFLNRLKSADNYDETLYILDEAIKLAGGEHSRMILIEAGQNAEQVNKDLAVYPRTTINNQILTIFLPSAKNFANDEQMINRYIEIVTDTVAKISDIKGVVIDLRGNTGGDMRPILGAISPFLSEGHLFSFLAKKRETSVMLKGNQILMDHKAIQLVKKVDRKQIPVAVLTDQYTASSAEIAVVALKGRENCRVFGQPTMGFATGVTQMALYGDYHLALATATLQDKEGNQYTESPIIPDILTNNPEEAASKWLLME